MQNSWKRTALTTLAVPLLAAPSAYGVYQYLAPESGVLAASSAAIGFELLYVGVNVLALQTAELRRYARRVAIAAVITAVTFNALAHYAAKVPAAFSGAAFAPLPAVLALITALPLAGLAYASSVLLHRIGMPTAEAAHDAPVLADHADEPVRAATIALPYQEQHLHAHGDAPLPIVVSTHGSGDERHACPACGTLLSLGKYAAARRYGYCAMCKQSRA
jgi:hypothetical protein